MNLERENFGFLNVFYVEDNPVLKVDSYGLVANSEGWLPWGYSYRWYHWYYTKYGVLIYIYPSRKCECEAGGKFGWIQRYENKYWSRWL